MPLRVEECPNCNHRAAAHGPLDAGVEVHCNGEDGACRCPLDRTAVGVAIAVAAALVKFG